MSNDNALYWIWFSLALGYNQHKAERIYSLYQDISVFYHGKEFEWALCGLFTNAEIKKLKDTTLEAAEKIIKDCERSGIDIISIENDLYPECLRQIYAPPAVLYVKGKMPDFENTLTIAMVGTRTATTYGMKTAFDFAYNLSKYGVLIVSGGALGIDSAAHNAALRAEAPTVCVLGCGIDCDYLHQNVNMRKAITVNGALISEYPPTTSAAPYRFPQRNRIISALSNGIIVIEAGASSGALITANLAIEQGKDVFAVMGNIDSPMSRGTNALIKEGAIPISDFHDVLNYYPNLYAVSSEQETYSDSEKEIIAIPIKGVLPKKDSGRTVKTPDKPELKKEKTAPVHIKNTGLEPFALSVYESIGAEPVHIDDLAVKLSTQVLKLLPVITELEIQGFIENAGGRCYKLPEN